MFFSPSDVSGQQSLDVRSLPSYPPSVFGEVVCLPDVQICAVLLFLLNNINDITMFMPGCFVLGIDTFHRCSHHIGNYHVVTFSRLLRSVCSGSFWGFNKGPVWVTTVFKCFPDVRLFLLLSLCVSGHRLSPMVKGSDDPQVFCTPQCWCLCLLQCVLHSPRRADCLWHLPMRACHDIIVNSLNVFCEGFRFPWSDFDPGVVHIPEPMAWSCSCWR